MVKSTQYTSAITKLPNGLYQAKMLVNEDNNGKPIYQHITGKTRLEVKETLLNRLFKGGATNG